MIKVKVYLYDSEAADYRGQDLSAYVLAGGQNTEDLTEEVDLSEITLQGLGREEAFDPETKFIIDIVEDGDLVETYHRVVEQDVCTKPILAKPDYYKHTISFIEPAGVAQKRVVDDISVTYLLRDVNLFTQPAYNINEDSKTSVSSEVPPQPSRGFDAYYDETSGSRTINISFGKYFKWENSDGQPVIKAVYVDNDPDSPTYGQQVESIKRYTNFSFINGAQVKFELPIPCIMWGKIDTSNKKPPLYLGYEKIGVASFDWKITEKNIDGDVTHEWTGTKHSNSDLYTDYKHRVTFPYDDSRFGWLLDRGGFNDDYDVAMAQFAERFNWLCEKIVATTKTPNVPMMNYYFRQYTSPTGSDLEAATQYTDTITVQENRYYEVEVTLHNYGTQMTQYVNPISATAQIQDFSTYEGELPCRFCYVKYKQGKTIFVSDIGTTYTPDLIEHNNAGGVAIYEVYGVSDITKMLERSIPYTAYDLLAKAIINSDTYFKEGTRPVCDLGENSSYPFYITDEDNDEVAGENTLRQTQVVENYYHQKNLWQMCLEVGKYIHAIPEIKFGDNDKFVISFNKLGRTKQTTRVQTRKSVMNFRKIDDYVSACSSYVDNLVQLGGEITETVAPKTTDETYLVTNKTAQIIVSKPIIEILRVTAVANKHYDLSYTPDGMPEITVTINAGDTADITDYIYEKSVYQILSIDKYENPNKGIAMYYELGSNTIMGGDYQLPQPTTNPYTDFAFKKILYCAFNNVFSPPYPTDFSVLDATGPWANLMVNDFTFIVTYRTKDTARLEHTRPDLRHYILSSKHDRYPVHRQFNNQEDILVDSAAFGQNVYGKLIRTGNNNYKETVWCKSTANMPRKGDLVSILADLYYVAKVTNIFYPNHIDSVVEYSKDYNQLSEIIGIPSEPRFYEISERNIIDREIAINDLLLVTTSASKIDLSNSLIANLTHTKNLIFGLGGTFLKWAKSEFKGDPDTPDGYEKTYGIRDFGKNTLNPVSAYSSGNTLTYEWDMVDNFSAGDDIGTEVVPTGNNSDPVDDAYRSLRAVQYCDKHGKSTLFDFKLYGDLVLDVNKIRELPTAPSTINETPVIQTTKSIALLKDCRETLHFNYNLMQITDSDTFVTSPFFFTPKDGAGIRAFVFDEEINKLSNGYVNMNHAIAELLGFSVSITANGIEVDVSEVEDYITAKSIALVIGGQSGSPQKFILAKNIQNTWLEPHTWYIGAPNKDNLFTRKQ